MIWLDIDFEFRRVRNAFCLISEEKKCEKTGTVIETTEHSESHSVRYDDERHILSVSNISTKLFDFNKEPIKVPSDSGEVKLKLTDGETKILWFPWTMTMSGARNFCKENEDHHIVIKYMKEYDKDKRRWTTLENWDNVKFRSILTTSGLCYGEKIW